MRWIDAETTRAALPFSRLIPALRERFISGCEVPLRHVHQVHQVQAAPGTGGEAVTSLLMPAWQPGGHYGVKIVNIAPGNAARGLPGLHSSYLLHDAATGVPLALIDGDQITARRTAAASAQGAKPSCCKISALVTRPGSLLTPCISTGTPSRASNKANKGVSSGSLRAPL